MPDIQRRVIEVNLTNNAISNSIVGSLEGAVTEVLSESEPVLIKRIGIKDTFGESGSLKDLFCKYGLTSESIVKEVKELIKKRVRKHSD